jgi:hypothetical protein
MVLSGVDPTGAADDIPGMSDIAGIESLAVGGIDLDVLLQAAAKATTATVTSSMRAFRRRTNIDNSKVCVRTEPKSRQSTRRLR